jgi:hypothetical protein
MRELPLGDEDVKRLCSGMVMNLALLAMQVGLGPGCNILGKDAPDISRRNKLPPRVGKVVQVKKMSFQNFSANTGQHTPVETSPTIGEKQW